MDTNNNPDVTEHQEPNVIPTQPTLVNCIYENNEETITDEFFCSVCMRLLVEPVSTPCGHTFCKSCIEQSLDYRATCPICRAPVPFGAQQNFLLSSIIARTFPKTSAQRRNDIQAANIQNEEETLLARAKQFAGERRLPLMEASNHVTPPVLPGESFEMEIRRPNDAVLCEHVSEGDRKFGLYWTAVDTCDKVGVCLEITERDNRNSRSRIRVSALHRFRVATDDLQVAAPTGDYIIAAVYPIFDKRLNVLVEEGQTDKNERTEQTCYDESDIRDEEMIRRYSAEQRKLIETISRQNIIDTPPLYENSTQRRSISIPTSSSCTESHLHTAIDASEVPTTGDELYGLRHRHVTGGWADPTYTANHEVGSNNPSIDTTNIRNVSILRSSTPQESEQMNDTETTVANAEMCLHDVHVGAVNYPSNASMVNGSNDVNEERIVSEMESAVELSRRILAAIQLHLQAAGSSGKLIFERKFGAPPSLTTQWSSVSSEEFSFWASRVVTVSETDRLYFFSTRSTLARLRRLNWILENSRSTILALSLGGRGGGSDCEPFRFLLFNGSQASAILFVFFVLLAIWSIWKSKNFKQHPHSSYG